MLFAKSNGEGLQVKRKFRTRAVFLITVWILLLAVSLSLLSILLATFNSNPQSQSIVSLSWAGYIIAKDFVNPQLEVIAINASWIVPKVNASAGDGRSSAWIGIGGQSDKTLIQVGTEHNSLGGQENYYVWYELLPDFAVRVTDIAVSPEDTIVASITLINSDTNQWNIQISDVTNGQAFSSNVIYNSTRSSGEWILERPNVNNQISTLSDFGNITFRDCYININHLTGTIAKFPFSKIQMRNSQIAQLTSVSTLSADGSSFTVSYQRGS